VIYFGCCYYSQVSRWILGNGKGRGSEINVTVVATREVEVIGSGTDYGMKTSETGKV
jgi:hypothetical protein